MTSRKESKIEKKGFVDTDFSSGDYNKKSKCKQQYREENNNEVDELSKDLQMGCIVDAVKRPPNICVETCVYEESDTEGSQAEVEGEDAYSDEFEDDKTDEDESIKMEPKSAKSETSARREGGPESSVKLSKSHSFMSNKPSVSSRSGKSSSQYGSLRVPQTRRINMSFSNERLREIERHNHILLTKILSARNNKKSSIPAPETVEPKRPQPNAALHRKKQQRQIDHENMILLRKIQRAKSSACSTRR